ncbi:MAG: hypothetical protein QE263_09935 [Vampirovibrionales bacterium]|nr:hypothetical protein [Vampirovibrionales bacterium]
MAIYSTSAANKSITGSQTKDANNTVLLKKGADDAKVNITQRGSENQDFITYADGGSIKQTTKEGKGRTYDGGNDNVFNKLDHTLADSSQSIFAGKYTSINNFDGSDGSDTIRLRGSNITAKDIDTGAGNDTATVVGKSNKFTGTLGDGDDRLNVRNGYVDANGADGSDFAFIGKGSTGKIKGFENIYVGDNDAPTTIADALKKNANGSYQLKFGDIDVNLGSNADAILEFKNGTKKTLADWLGGTTVTPPATGEINQSDFNAGDINNIDGKKKKLNDINLGLEDDVLNVDKDTTGTATGGEGTDKVNLAEQLNKYKIEKNTDGSYKFTHNDSGKIVNLSDFERYNFGGTQSILAADLMNYVAPVFNDDINTYNAANESNAVNKNINLLGGADILNVADTAKNYSFAGGAGADAANVAGTFADDAAIKSRFSYDNNTGQFKDNTNNNVFSGFENFKFGSLAKTIQELVALLQ